MKDANTRTEATRQVIGRHLECRRQKDIEKDIANNYAADVVLFHIHGKERGYDGIRKSAGRLTHQLPEAEYRFKSCVFDGPYAYLEWEADSPKYLVRDGADSFVVENGRIAMQSVYYRLLERNG